MTNDNILKLLGGYATNTLTESERKTLFEAALEDQKLFDALQEEEALKELLADAAARAEITRALEEPRRESWWMRRWVWAGALTAAAAGVAGLVMIRPFEHPRQILVASSKAPTDGVGQIAPNPPQPAATTSEHPANATVQPLADVEQRKKLALAKERDSIASNLEPTVRARPSATGSATAPPAPAPAPPAPSNNQPITPRAMIAGKSAGQVQNTIATGSTADSIGALQQNALNFKGPPPLNYSLVKRDTNGADTTVSQTELKPGDVVRIRVFCPVSGSVFLLQKDAVGNLRRVFPPDAQALSMAAGTTATIDFPITISKSTENFRLIVEPGGADLQTDSRVAGAQSQMPTPLVDIKLGPAN